MLLVFIGLEFRLYAKLCFLWPQEWVWRESVFDSHNGRLNLSQIQFSAAASCLEILKHKRKYSMRWKRYITHRQIEHTRRHIYFYYYYYYYYYGYYWYYYFHSDYFLCIISVSISIIVLLLYFIVVLCLFVLLIPSGETKLLLLLSLLHTHGQDCWSFTPT